MAESTQDNLNGAFYGPPVPPRHSNRSVGRGSGSCCCGPCCLPSTLFKFLSIVITLGVIALVLWLVLRPNEVEVYVEEASLARFNLNADGTLNYNLTMTVSVCNPNRRISIYYDYVEARAIYDGSRFGSVTLQSFFQGHKNTSMLYPAFQGQRPAQGTVSATFNRERGEGFFYVDVKIHTKVRFKVWFVKTNKYTPDADCRLRFPVPSGGSPSVVSRTKCDVDLFG